MIARFLRRAPRPRPNTSTPAGKWAAAFVEAQHDRLIFASRLAELRTAMLLSDDPAALTLPVLAELRRVDPEIAAEVRAALEGRAR